MYSGFKVCEALDKSHRCFYVRRYWEGDFEEICHEHIPRSRMSADSAKAALQALVVKHSSWSDEHTLHSYMNKRAKHPPGNNNLNLRVEYPAEGVVRVACCNSNIEAWVDEHVNK
jgi:hypothetical protein